MPPPPHLFWKLIVLEWRRRWIKINLLTPWQCAVPCSILSEKKTKKPTILLPLHLPCLSTWMLQILALWVAGATRWPAASFPPISYPMMTGEQLPKCCQQQQLALVKSAEHTDASLSELCGVIALLYCSRSMWWHLSPDTLHLLGLVLLSFSYSTSYNIGVDCIKGWFSPTITPQLIWSSCGVQKFSF